MINLKSFVLVFVHLNTALPDFLIANIRRTRQLFPDLSICLASNIDQAYPHELDIDFKKVNSSKFARDLSSHSWDRNFRSGFWQTSILRILILDEIHSLYVDKLLLHIESDVMLSNFFPFEILSEEKKILWCSFGPNVDVGALIFSPSPKQTSFLVKNLRHEIVEDSRLTDMTGLYRVRIKNPNFIGIFPSSEGDTRFDGFQCIFDGAALGMWLFGEDTRNHFGFLRRFRNLSGSFTIYRKGDIFFDLNGDLSCRNLSRPARVASVHVHSKDVRLFELGSGLYNKRVKQSQRRFNLPVFEFDTFVSLFKQAQSEGNLKAFIYYFPFFGVVIRKLHLVIKSLSRN